MESLLVLFCPLLLHSTLFSSSQGGSSEFYQEDEEEVIGEEEWEELPPSAKSHGFSSIDSMIRGGHIDILLLGQSVARGELGSNVVSRQVSLLAHITIPFRIPLKSMPSMPRPWTFRHSWSSLRVPKETVLSVSPLS